MVQIKKYIKKAANAAGLGAILRELRKMGYLIFDFFGFSIFSMLKIFKLIPPDIKFQKELVEKILIIRIDRIGDIILSTPALRALRQSYPKAQVHLLVSDYTKDLVVNNKNADKIIIFKKDILDNDYDLAIALHPGIIENKLTFKSGAKFRIGYSGRGGSFYLTDIIKDDRDIRVRHEVISALEAVGRAGCSIEDKSLEVSLSKEGEAFADEFFRENKLSKDDFVVMIHPGARQEYIRWKKDGFAEVADRLIKEKNAKIILLSGKDELDLITDVKSLMHEEPIIVSDIALRELVSLTGKVKLFIGNSTGPMHIASALKIPLIAIFGARHPLDSLEAWGPWGEDNCGVQAVVDCKNCHPSDCRNNFKCMSKIEAKEVFQAINMLLKRRTERLNNEG